MKIYLAGNPNCGKTTLFNALTGLNQKIGNYSGVTVDKFSGFTKIGNQKVEFVDLPGTYSIFPNSADESVVFNTLLSNESPPDSVVVVINATQLRRGLILATQVMQLDLPCILAINMIDEANKEDVLQQKKQLEKVLQVPICLISARNKTGFDELKKQLLAGGKLSQIAFQPEDEDLADKLAAISGSKNTYQNFVSFCLAEQANHLPEEQKEDLIQLRKKQNFSVTKAMAKDINYRYQMINQWLKTEHPKRATSLHVTQKIDRILTHKYWGLPIAFFILLLIFQAIFSFASYPMDYVEAGFAGLSSLVEHIVPEGWLQDILINGVIAGLAGVLVFVPQIAILFGLLAILEGTGYMARISFMLDRLMRKFGLSGRAVLPMMSGFACAIPAVMATRTIPSWKERLISILVIPLLSCSARLPVYVLLIGLFIPKTKLLPFLDLQGFTMMCFYLAGLALALIIAAILQKVLGVKEQHIFVMELPKYRMPQWRNVLLTMYQKAKIFAIEAGKVILVISIILWVLASYGPPKNMQEVHAKYEQVQESRELTADEERSYSQELLVNSYAGIIGHTIEPVIRPLGYDWKIGIALLTSFAAREVFVGTMATIYSVEYDEEKPESLQERMLAEVNSKTGKPVYTFATVFSLLIFFAFAMQCMSTLAIVYRETKSWKWPIIQLVYMTILAYALSFVAFQVLS